MKAFEFISRLDEARQGRKLSEDTTPVAKAPSHAPTSGSDPTTTGKPKSEDEGETVKKAYKQPSGSVPAPVAPAPSRAPTSGKDYTTTGGVSIDDEGQPIQKSMKEAIQRLIGGDVDAIENFLKEGGHKAGCACGFCKNKGGFKKKGECKTDADCKDDPKCDTGKMSFKQTTKKDEIKEAADRLLSAPAN
jgi:hypothetical protein